VDDSSGVGATSGAVEAIDSVPVSTGLSPTTVGWSAEGVRFSWTSGCGEASGTGSGSAADWASGSWTGSGGGSGCGCNVGSWAGSGTASASGSGGGVGSCAGSGAGSGATGMESAVSTSGGFPVAVCPGRSSDGTSGGDSGGPGNVNSGWPQAHESKICKIRCDCKRFIRSYSHDGRFSGNGRRGSRPSWSKPAFSADLEGRVPPRPQTARPK